MNNEEKFEVKHKESTDTNNIKIDGKSMMSIENNLISRKKVKIKTLRRLNLDVPDDLVQYDNESQKASIKPQSRNQMLESYGELTHRSMFFPKPKQIENNKKNSSTHIENLKEIKNKLNTETKNENDKENDINKIVENDNFSNKDEERQVQEENVEKETNKNIIEEHKRRKK